MNSICMYFKTVLNFLILILISIYLGPKALDCPALASLSHAQLVGSSRRIGSVVTAVCDGGYVFAEGGKVRTVVCLPSGRWSISIKDCVGGYATYGFNEQMYNYH